MRNILVTGGTTFVSRYTAEYFLRHGYCVHVLNRGTKPQSCGVHWIQGDRHSLGDQLRGIHFDAVLDVTAYTAADIQALLHALYSFEDYIFISSSAVYPETLHQPFREDMPCGPNIHWGSYGINKLAAEQYLSSRVPQAYILRPPYLYGPMQNLYREPFVFDCALQQRPFCLPDDGHMPLQFFHVEDLCRFMDILLHTHPSRQIFNVGNPETVSVMEWVQLCYDVCGIPLQTRILGGEHPRHRYFCFRDYGYCLNVDAQTALMPHCMPLKDGLAESLRWYLQHQQDVQRKAYLDYLSHLELE